MSLHLHPPSELAVARRSDGPSRFADRGPACASRWRLVPRSLLGARPAQELRLTPDRICGSAWWVRDERPERHARRPPEDVARKPICSCYSTAALGLRLFPEDSRPGRPQASQLRSVEWRFRHG